MDRPALQPLPAQPYVMAEWKSVRANIDYHVEIDRHYYSVPYQLVGRQLEARFTAMTVEIFHRSLRVASSSAQQCRLPAHHQSRASAKESPGASGMDSVPPDSLG